MSTVSSLSLPQSATLRPTSSEQSKPEISDSQEAISSARSFNYWISRPQRLLRLPYLQEHLPWPHRQNLYQPQIFHAGQQCDLHKITSSCCSKPKVISLPSTESKGMDYYSERLPSHLSQMKRLFSPSLDIRELLHRASLFCSASPSTELDSN
jgi:hypothetical protein